MDTVELINKARDAGLALSLTHTGDIKVVGPKTSEIASIVESLRLEKPSVILALRAEAVGDLTDWVGKNVSRHTWGMIVAECQHRYSGRWTMSADEVETGFHVTSLNAKPERPE